MLEWNWKWMSKNIKKSANGNVRTTVVDGEWKSTDGKQKLSTDNPYCLHMTMNTAMMQMSM
jgi:hypothetical protein